MKVLKGHFDGQHVVLDEPAMLAANAKVIVSPDQNGANSNEEESLAAEFGSLSKRWREEVGAESSLTKITGNMNYLRVISLGKRVIPLILKELQREPAPWFLALRAITGEQQIGREHAGNFRRMADCWIAWGKENGYI